MSTGAKFPPIVVFFDGKTRWLGDGFHRVGAHTKLGHARIECDVRQGSQRDAILFSVTANATHGLRRTNADKRHAVELLLGDAKWSKKSDRWLAEMCGVSDPFVGKARREVLTVSTSSTREGRDGKQQPASKPKGKPASTMAAPALAPPLSLAMAPTDEASALADLQSDIERHFLGWTWGIDQFVAALKASAQRARDHVGVKQAANG